jgi:hypothetical protein
MDVAAGTDGTQETCVLQCPMARGSKQSVSGIISKITQIDEETLLDPSNLSLSSHGQPIGKQ